MKRASFFFFLLLGLVLLAIITTKLKSNIATNKSEVTQEKLPAIEAEKIVLETNGVSYSYFYYLVPDKEDVLYINNLSEKKETSEIYLQNKCNLAINAGFYTKQDTPLGLLMIDNKLLSSEIKNSPLLNGFVYKKKEKLIVSDSFDSSGADFVFQSGPLLKIDGEEVATLQNDVMARRVILLNLSEDKTAVIVVYNSNSYFSGPTLDELGLVLTDFEEKSGYLVINAINLDGGTASAFLCFKN